MPAVDRRRRRASSGASAPLAGQHLVAELEAGVDEALGEVGRGRVDQVRTPPRPSGSRPGSRRRSPRSSGRRSSRRTITRSRPGQVRGVEEGAPGEARRERLQLRHAHRVVGLDRVALFDLAPAGLGDPGLQGDDRRGVRLRVGPAGHPQHLGDIGLVLGLLRREAGLQVVVAVRQAEAGLAEFDGVAVRVLGVGADAHAEDRQSK